MNFKYNISNNTDHFEYTVYLTEEELKSINEEYKNQINEFYKKGSDSVEKEERQDTTIIDGLKKEINELKANKS